MKGRERTWEGKELLLDQGGRKEQNTKRGFLSLIVLAD